MRQKRTSTFGAITGAVGICDLRSVCAWQDPCLQLHWRWLAMGATLAHALSSTSSVSPLVIFMLDEARYALRLEWVERVAPIVDIAPLPKAPDIVLGIVNLRGTIFPVMNVRKRFGLPLRSLKLSDHLILARMGNRKVALHVDAVTEIRHCSDEAISAAEAVLPTLDYVEGVLKLSEGLILIHALSTFLSLEEQQLLDQAILKQNS